MRWLMPCRTGVGAGTREVGALAVGCDGHCWGSCRLTLSRCSRIAVNACGWLVLLGIDVVACVEWLQEQTLLSSCPQ